MSEEESEYDFAPNMDGDDDAWLRWIERREGKLDMEFHGDWGLHETDEQTKLLRRFARALTKSSERIRELVFNYHLEDGSIVNDYTEMNMALCAFITVLHNQLESLTFFVVNSDLLNGLRFVPPMTQLQKLDLSESSYENSGERIADVLRLCPNLTDLNLSSCQLNDNDLAAIGSVSFSSLEILKISFNGLTSRGLEIVAGMLKGCHQIRQVYFDDYHSKDKVSGTSEVLASLANKQHLERLQCTDVDSGAAHHLQMMVNLRDLSISFSGTDFGILCSHLRGMQRLSTLSLNCKKELSVESDQHLADLLCSLNQLTELDLPAPSSSFKHLGAYLGSSDCRLTKLSVHAGTKTDLLPVVSALRSNGSLKRFSMAKGDCIYDLPMELCQVLRQNKTLREFSWDRSLSPEHWTMIVEGARYSAIECLGISVWGSATDEMHRLLDDVANQGYLVNVGDFRASKSCRQRMDLNKRMHDAARKAALAMLAVRRFRKSALNTLQKDIVKMVAMMLYATRANDAWSNALGQQKKQKRLKTRTSTWMNWLECM